MGTSQVSDRLILATIREIFVSDGRGDSCEYVALGHKTDVKLTNLRARRFTRGEILSHHDLSMNLIFGRFLWFE